MVVERQAATRRKKTDLDIDDPPTGATLEGLTFLGASFMLALISGTSVPEHAKVSGWLRSADDDAHPHRRKGDAQRLHGSSISAPSSTSKLDAALVLLQTENQDKELATTGKLVLDGADGTVALEPIEIMQATLPPEQFGLRHMANLDVAVRATILEKIIPVIAQKTGALVDAALALSILSDHSREQLPVVETNPSADCAGTVEGVWRVGPSSFYVKGWVFDRKSSLGGLRLITPEGRRAEILRGACWYTRPDVSEFFAVRAHKRLGFIAYVDLPEESVLGAGWILQADRIDDVGFEVPVPQVVDDPVSLRTMILGDLQLENRASQGLLHNHIVPAITRLEERLSERIEIDTIDQHGTPPADPEATIVIPLFHHVEFLEYQLAEFVNDPELHRVDLIYVLDSPEDAARLRPSARHLFDLYGVPFRLVTLTGNGGFSVVNNLGASLARGRMLLLLNSDVLPSQPGWLSRMIDFYNAQPNIGALAPKLLYEDDSIQHAGLYFDRAPGEESWSNEHYYKGLHRLFPAANVARQVPAVTGACLMISTALYRTFGGLRGIYIRGDYEDSDLCLRLREQGRDCWYLPDVELYHLEGQSYPSTERELTSQFNKWLHTSFWNQTIEHLMTEPPRGHS
jgi:GT2 family glycosyltransferase